MLVAFEADPVIMMLLDQKQQEGGLGVWGAVREVGGGKVTSPGLHYDNLATDANRVWRRR